MHDFHPCRPSCSAHTTSSRIGLKILHLHCGSGTEVLHTVISHISEEVRETCL